MNPGVRALVLVGVMVSPVCGQEMPRRFDWSGGHLGVHAGVGSGELTYGYYTAPPKFVSFDVNGYVAGVQAGYDWQFGQLILGLSGELSGSNISGATDGGPKYPCDLDGCSANVDWLGTVSIRAGVVIDRFMPFITAGLTAGGVRGSANLEACGVVVSCGFSGTSLGKSFGIGLEVAVDDHMSLLGKIERVDLGEPAFNNSAGGGMRSSDLAFSNVSVGANWRF